MALVQKWLKDGRGALQLVMGGGALFRISQDAVVVREVCTTMRDGRGWAQL